MTRDELEHVIRAAADVSGDEDIVVVGSQAILGQYPDAPDALLRSMEADVYPRHHPERAELIDGAMGDGSRFHETFGYYAHGVGHETATPPAGWEGRLIAVETAGGTGWCLDAHDLVLAKCAAGREGDWQFAREALVGGLVSLPGLERRVADLPVSSSGRETITSHLRAVDASAEES